MTLDRMKLSAQTVRDNIAILEECEEPDDAGYYLQLEHEKFVLECIEKQIPKKPKITINNGFCPQCKNALGRKEIEKASLTGFKYFGFCPICGQALDWGDTNETK